MFIITARLPRRALALAAAALALLCCALLAVGLVPPAARLTAGEAQPNPRGIRTNQDRIAYLQGYGWEVSPEPIATEELLIPEEMDDSYTGYLALQSAQGFDLARYSGKRVKRYTYEIRNYPTGETGVVANLLIYKKAVVGGEVLSQNLDGFLHGLAMP